MCECLCSLNTSRILILLFISSVMMLAPRDPLNLPLSERDDIFFVCVCVKKSVFSCILLFFNLFLCIICVTVQGTCTEGLCDKRIIFFLSNKIITK